MEDQAMEDQGPRPKVISGCDGTHCSLAVRPVPDGRWEPSRDSTEVVSCDVVRVF